MLNEKYLKVSPLFVLSIAGIAGTLFATARGIGISGDSVVYLDAARNIMKGLGFVNAIGGEYTPITHYPPLFPIILSFLGRLGIDLQIAARWLNAFLFGATILLVGIILRRYTCNSTYVPLLGSFLTLTSASMLDVHTMAHSEPLFLFFTISGLYLLAVYIENKKMARLLASAGAFSIAFLSRYIGGALVLTGTIVILSLSRNSHRKRIVDSVIFIAVSIFPMVFFIIRNFHVSGQATSRSLAFHPITLNHLHAMMITFSSWLLPGSDRFTILPAQDVITAVVLITLIIGMAVLAKYLCKKTKKNESSHLESNPATLTRLFIIYIIIYIASIILSASLFDRIIPFDNRIFAPLFIPGLIIVLFLLHRLFLSSVRQRIKSTFLILSVVFACFYLASGVVWIIYSHNNGRGLIGRSYQYHQILAELNTLPIKTVIYSDKSRYIYFMTGRPSYSIPDTNNTQALAEMICRLKNKGGAIAYFNVKYWYPSRPTGITSGSNVLSEDDLHKILPLRLLAKERHASVYQVRSKLD